MSRAQSGMTLVVSLIMLIVLTLLVVSAIRFGNINLKITRKLPGAGRVGRRRAGRDRAGNCFGGRRVQPQRDERRQHHRLHWG